MPSHILLAEDHFDLQELIREILEAQGYRVTSTADGQEALTAFERETPDLIVADVVMPHMDGFALLKAVRAHPAGSAVPFMFLSARHEPAVRAEARVLGADDYLFKPFSADDLVQAVQAKLERRRATQRFDTRAAHLQTVSMLANVIETRDRYTRGHVGRVQQYALELGRELKWDGESLLVLEFGALLHDVGKILVPRAILNKPKRLVTAEWAVMRRHPEIGAQMLAEVDHLRGAIPYILYHHERWDGQGYPAGLARNTIPPEGRLLAIADTYDAMTSDRAYRPAMGHERAVDEIRKGSGSQFDPEMGVAFIRLREAAFDLGSASAGGAPPQ